MRRNPLNLKGKMEALARWYELFSSVRKDLLASDYIPKKLKDVIRRSYSEFEKMLADYINATNDSRGAWYMAQAFGNCMGAVQEIYMMIGVNEPDPVGKADKALDYANDKYNEKMDLVEEKFREIGWTEKSKRFRALCRDLMLIALMGRETIYKAYGR